VRRALLRQYVLWLVGYLLLALVITWPAVLSPLSAVMGSTVGDNFEMMRNTWWFRFALLNGEPFYYQTYLGYPQGFSSIALAANQLQYFPAWVLALFLPLPLTYNVMIWLTMALNGWAMAVLMRDLLQEDAPALAAGAVFMTAPTLQAHLVEGHAGLLVMWPVPLFVWALLRALRTEHHFWAWGAAAVVLFNLSPSGHMLQVIYVLMPLSLAIFLWLVSRQEWRSVQRLVVILGAAGAVLLLFLQPMIRDTLATSAYVEAGGAVRYSADLLSIVSPSFYHPLWGGLPWPRAVLGVNMAEGSSYIGVVVALLALLALWRRPEARWWGWLALLAYGLSLGPLLKVMDQPVVLDLGDYRTFVPLPWALVQDVTGFNLARTPGRFNFTLALAAAALAGYGADVLWQWGRRWKLPQTARLGALAALTALSVFDTQMFFPVPLRSADIPQAVYDLRTREDVRAVFNVPWQHLLAAKDALYLQTAHEKPLIAGQVTRQTPVNPSRLNVMQRSLSPALLREYGADVVILHVRRAADLNQAVQLQAALDAWGTLLYRDDDIRIYDVPPADPLAADLLLEAEDGTFRDRFVHDFYAHEVGWLDLDAVLSADQRDVTVVLNGVPYQTFRVSGRIPLRLPLPIDRPGFHRLELRLAVPCPAHDLPELACRTLSVERVRLERGSREYVRPQIAYKGGVTLVAASFTTVGDTLTVRLLWDFDAPITETHVRFVHVLQPEGGAPLVQDDRSLGAQPANSLLLESFSIPLRDLPLGDYSLRVGWYDFPTLRRFAVLDDSIRGAVDGAPEVATVRIGP
jgi:hypothetical protein